MKATDEQLKTAWCAKGTETYRNYAAIGRMFGMARQNVRARILKLRADGEDLPESRPAGYTMTRVRAKELRKRQLERK